MFTLIKLDTSTYSHIAVITLNRPEAANALNKQLLEELQLAIKQINDEQSVFCTIITGEGSKAFCAGADLKERQHMNEHEVVKAVQLIGDTILKVEQMRMPVIAALNGVAFGGG